MGIMALPACAARAADGDFLWAKAMGGRDYEHGSDMAVDAAGNVYITGYFSGTVDFDPGLGTLSLSSASAGSTDIFVLKLDTLGNFLWARAMGGKGDDWGSDIAVDSAGNVHTTGFFKGAADFDPGPGTCPLTSAGGDDVFVSKLDRAGNFVWAKAMGGEGNDYGRGIAVDGAGNVHTTGEFLETADFDPGSANYPLTTAGSSRVGFVSKLDSAGNFLWAGAMGGTDSAESNDIAIDSAGNVHTTGYFYGTVDFNPGPDAFDLTSQGRTDAFVLKLDNAGNFLWAKALGGTDDSLGEGIAVDGAGNVHSTGCFGGTVDCDPGAGSHTLSSASRYTDIFVSKLDSAGNFLWAKRMGGTGSDWGLRIAVDGAQRVFTTGYFSGSADFDPGPGTFALSSAGKSDIFASKLDGAGNFVTVKAMGGTGDDWGNGIAVDSGGSIYTTGLFNGTADFDPGTNAYPLVSAGGDDIFVSKLSGPPPTGTIVINNNRTATKSTDVTLALTWTCGVGGAVTRMRFSNDGATWSAWEASAVTRAYTLPGADGYKTVRVQFMDKAQNRSTVFNDYILLDTAPPTGGILINNGAATTTTGSVTLNLKWADTGAGVTRMRFSDNGSTWTVWESPKATHDHVLPVGNGFHTVRVQYIDGAENYSPVYSDYIKLVAP
jgi:hypothetical protein